MAETRIRKAIEYLKRYGWTKGQDIRYDGSACAIGAITSVAHSHVCLVEDMKELDYVAVEQYPDRANSPRGLRPIASFNDHPDTTFEEVLALMEKAAIRREETLDEG